MSEERSSKGGKTASTLWLGYCQSLVKQKEVKAIFNGDELARIDSISIRRVGSRSYCFVNFNSSFTARHALERLGESTRLAGTKVTVSLREDYPADGTKERATASGGSSLSVGTSSKHIVKRKDKNSSRYDRAQSQHDDNSESNVDLNGYADDDDDDMFYQEDPANYAGEQGARLFLGGIAGEDAEENVRRTLKPVQSDITTITVKRNKTDRTAFAYVNFSSYSAGRDAARLVKKDSSLRASTVHVYKNKEEDEEFEAKLAKRKPPATSKSSHKGPKDLPHLWVGNLPAKTSEKDVWHVFKKFANYVDSVHLSQVNSRRRLRYAFVNFITRQSAEEAQKFTEDAVVHDMTIITKLTLPRTFKEEASKQLSVSAASPVKPPASETNGVNSPVKPKVKPTATVLPQTAERKPAVVQTAAPQKGKMHKLTKKLSHRVYRFGLECFANEIRLLQSLHPCDLHWSDGVASLVSSDPSSGEELMSTVFNEVTEVEEKLSVDEWDYLMSESIVDNDSQTKTSRFTQLMVPWSTNPHICVVSDEGSHTLAFVGTCKATTVAHSHVLAFRKTCLCLPKSKVAYLRLYLPKLAMVLEERFSVKLNGIQEGSSVLKLSGNNTSQVAEAKQYIESELTDWHSISIRLHTCLSNSAIKRFKCENLSVVLVLDAKPTPTTKDQLSPFILAGRPASHVRQAASLLQPIQRTMSLLEGTAEKMLKPGHATCLAALEEELNVYLHLVSNAGGYHLTIISFLDSDVEEAVLRLTALDSNESKCMLRCGLSRVPLASHYLHHLLNKSLNSSARAAVQSIQEEFQIRITWDDTLKSYFLHGSEVNIRHAEQAILESSELLGITGALVLLPSLDSGLIFMLHRHFLSHVEGKMSVKCLALAADAAIISSGDLDSAVQPGTVVVGIFGPSAERVKQAQDWVSNLSPASRDLKLSTPHLVTVHSGWKDGSLSVAQLEEQHGVLLQLREDSQIVHAAGLTLKDVEAALQHVLSFANTMTKITEQITLSVEQVHFIRSKFESELNRSPCVTTFNTGATPSISIKGSQDAVVHLKALVSQQVASLVAVHVTVRYPELLHSLLEHQWESLCENAAHHPGVICLRQKEPFSVSDPTPLTMFDCRSYLSFPPRVAATVRCMSFLVAGVSKEQFASVLQQLRSTSCGFLTQQVRLTSAQKAAVEKQYTSGKRVSMAALHIAEDDTLHIFSLSPADLQHAHQQVLSWVAGLSNAEIVTVNNPNVAQFINEELSREATAVGRDFQLIVEVNTDHRRMHALLNGAKDRVQLAKIELQKRWKRIEETIVTKYVYVQHWLVPVLEQQATKEQIVGLERRHSVACSLHTDTLQSYVESIKAPVSDGKSVGINDLMNPTAFSWPVCGKEASSVNSAVEEIRHLLDVSLDERELCVPGVAMDSVKLALGKVSRIHLVQFNIRSDNAGYRGQEAALSGFFSASLDVTVRGIAPRPLAALHQLQADLDL